MHSAREGDAAHGVQDIQIHRRSHRANLMKQAQSFNDVDLPMLLPGIKLNTSTKQVTPIRQLQMARFNGKS